MAEKASIRGEVREIRDMSIANKTLLDSRIAVDVDHHRTVERSLDDIRSDTDKRHIENNQKFDATDRKIEQLSTSFSANVADIHGRITRLGTEVTDKINETTSQLTNKINETSSDQVTKLNETAWASVKWISGVVGAILLLGIALIGYLLSEGAPWQHHDNKPAVSKDNH